MFEKVKNFVERHRNDSINREIVKEYRKVIWREINGILCEIENSLNEWENMINELYQKIIEFDGHFNRAEWIRSMNIVYGVMKRTAVHRRVLNEAQMIFPHESRISSINKRLTYCEKNLVSVYHLMDLLDLV